MQWELVIALVIVVPIILFPAAYIWYINIGGIYATIKEALTFKKKAVQEQEYERALIEALKKYPWQFKQ